MTELSSFAKSEWWAQVKYAPEVKSSAVPAVDAPNGEGFIKDFGGHITPISIIGTKELVKNDQKKPKNNSISLIINIIKLTTKPLRTTSVWKPRLLSSFTSFTQRRAQPIDRLIPNKSNFIDLKLNNLMKPKTIVRNPQDKTIGHGLWSTKW